MTRMGGPRETGPRQKQRHYSYNENVDEAGKLIDKETADIEHEVPSDEREPVERPPVSRRRPPAFEEEE